MQKIKQLFSKFAAIITDYSHILFKPAPENHLRIQQCQKDTSGKIVCSVSFASYSELKKLQKKLRKYTVGLSSAVAMIIVAFLIAPYVMNPNRSSASNFQWIQGDWVTKAVDIASAPGNKTGWNKYADMDSTLIVDASGVTMAEPSPAETGDIVGEYATKATAGNGTDAGTFDSATLYKTTSNLLSLKKPKNASCVGETGAACLSGECVENTCVTACNSNTICGETCAYNGDIYKTVAITGSVGERCWFAENLRTTKNPDGSDISTGMFCSPNGCGSPWGRHYTWYTATRDVSATGTGAKIQGICPSGWHIPSNYNGANVDDFPQLKNAVASSANRLKDCVYFDASCTASNTIGFSAVGAGNTLNGTAFNYFKTDAYFHTSYKTASNYVGYTKLNSTSDSISMLNSPVANSGYSLRCVQN